MAKRSIIAYVAENYSRIDFYSNKMVHVNDLGRSIAAKVKLSRPDLPLLRVDCTLEDEEVAYFKETDIDEAEEKGELTRIERPDLSGFDAAILIIPSCDYEVREPSQHLLSLFDDKTILFVVTYDNYNEESMRSLWELQSAFPYATFFKPFAEPGHIGDSDIQKAVGIFAQIEMIKKTSQGYFFPPIWIDLDKANKSPEGDAVSPIYHDYFYLGGIFLAKKKKQNHQIFEYASGWGFRPEDRNWHYWALYLDKEDDLSPSAILDQFPEFKQPSLRYFDMALLEYDEDHIERMIEKLKPLLEEGIIREYGIANIPLEKLKALLKKGYSPSAIRLSIDLLHQQEDYLAFLKEMNIIPFADARFGVQVRDGLFQQIANRKHAEVTPYNILYRYFQDKGFAPIAPLPLTDKPFLVRHEGWTYTSESVQFYDGVTRGYFFDTRLTEEDLERIETLIKKKKKG